MAIRRNKVAIYALDNDIGKSKRRAFICGGILLFSANFKLIENAIKSSKITKLCKKNRKLPQISIPGVCIEYLEMRRKSGRNFEMMASSLIYCAKLLQFLSFSGDKIKEFIIDVVWGLGCKPSKLYKDHWMYILCFSCQCHWTPYLLKSYQRTTTAISTPLTLIVKPCSDTYIH